MSRVIVPDARQEPVALRAVHAPAIGWEVLTWIGLAFVVVGAVDLGLAWYPLQFGNVDWEFGILAVTLDNLPLPALGFTFLVVAALSDGKVWQVRTASVCCALLTAVLLGGLVVYLLTVPLALKAELPARFSIKKAVLKTLVQFAMYLLVFGVLTVKTWRATRAARAGVAPAG